MSDGRDASQSNNVILLVGPDKVKIKIPQEILIKHCPTTAKTLSIKYNELGKPIGPDWNEEGDPIIKFEDSDPTTFSLLVNCLQNGFEETLFKPTNWPKNLEWNKGLMDIYNLARSLKMTDVIKSVEDALRSVNETNAIQIFQEAKNSNFPELAEKALNIILRHPMIAFGKKNNYKMLTTQTFNEIFTHPDLKLETKDAYQIAKLWIRNEEMNLIYSKQSVDHLKMFSNYFHYVELTDESIMTIEEKERILQLIYEARSSKSNTNGDSNIRPIHSYLKKLPMEIVSELMSHFSRPDIINCYLASPVFYSARNLPEQMNSIRIKNKEQLEVLGAKLIPNSHNFTHILLVIHDFEPNSQNFLLNYIESSRYRMEVTLELQVCQGYLFHLKNFLYFLMCHRIKVVSLKLCDVERNFFLGSPSRDISVQCPSQPIPIIIFTLDHCPNLQSFTMGRGCDYGVVSLDQIFRHFSKSNIEINWLIPINLDPFHYDPNLFSKLKRNGIIFKKINLGRRIEIQEETIQEFLMAYADTVEEIYSLNPEIWHWAIRRLKFPNLTTLKFECMRKYEPSIFRPNFTNLNGKCMGTQIQSPFRHLHRTSRPGFSQSGFPQSGSSDRPFVLPIDVDNNGIEFDTIAPNLKELVFMSEHYHDIELLRTPLIHFLQPVQLCLNLPWHPRPEQVLENLNLIYQNFIQLEHIELLLDHHFGPCLELFLAGVSDHTRLTVQHQDINFRRSQHHNYIGKLTNLRVLKISTFDRRFSPVHLNALRCGICHLTQLRELSLSLPSHELDGVREVLQVLAVDMPQLEEVQLVVPYPMMKVDGVQDTLDNLKSSFQHSFLLTVRH